MTGAVAILEWISKLPYIDRADENETMSMDQTQKERLLNLNICRGSSLLLIKKQVA